MRIAKKRVISIENYLGTIDEGANFYIGLLDIDNFRNKLIQIGFSEELNTGEQVLPTVLGTKSRFNANGGFILLRDLPKETYLREIEFKDWHGNYHTRYAAYLRYQRRPIPAPNVELLIRNGADSQKILVSPLLINHTNNYDYIKHVINLFLELFGECEILQENLIPTFNVQVTRLNWDILPQGNYPWQVLGPRVKGVIDTINRQRRGVVQRYIQRISEHNPDFVAVGRAGFRGYLVFGFPDKDFFILESIYTGNATYVLGQNWQVISQLTKEEILLNDLYENRLVHTEGWDNRIDELLN
jgi:hypothetical protein